MSPYYEYLKDVESLSRVPIDFPLAFELLLVSVFRHWFAPPKTVDAEENAEPKKPKEISDFFLDTPIFGNWEEFACYGNFLKFPRVSVAFGQNRIDAFPAQSPERSI